MLDEACRIVLGGAQSGRVVQEADQRVRVPLAAILARVLLPACRAPLSVTTRVSVRAWTLGRRVCAISSADQAG